MNTTIKELKLDIEYMEETLKKERDLFEDYLQDLETPDNLLEVQRQDIWDLEQEIRYLKKKLETKEVPLTETFNTVYEALIGYEYFTEEELRLVTDLNGNTVEVLNDCIYARYGYRNLKQLRESEE